MYFPEEIRNKDDLRIIATTMKRANLSIPIKGYRVKNGEKLEAMYAYARADETGDDILLETRNVRDPIFLPLWDVYPQLIDFIKKQRITA